MAAIAVTYSFTNGTTSDATQVNQNFTDIINGLSDGTKDISVSAGTFAGNVSISGNTTIGNASGDDLTVTASLASSIPIKTTNSYDIGSSTLGLRALYFGANSQTVKLQGSSSMSATWTFTFPVTAGTVNYNLETDGSGVASWTKKRTTPMSVENYGLTATVGSSALTVTLVGADGSALSSTNYVLAVFRNSTLGTGTPTEVKITSALTLTVSSGSTLGQTSAAQAALYVYLINNAGTAELAISQSIWDEKYLTTTTAEGGGGAADSGSVLYSTTARSNVAFRLIGKIVNTQATAGTWATNPSQIQLCDYTTASAETITARYTTNAGQSIASGGTPIVDYEDISHDNRTSVTTGASWKFTAPISGTYKVTGKIRYANNQTWTQGNSVSAQIFKNGSSYAVMASLIFTTFTPANDGPFCEINDTVRLLAGEYVDIRTSHGEATARTLLNVGSYNVVSVDRIGNYL